PAPVPVTVTPPPATSGNGGGANSGSGGATAGGGTVTPPTSTAPNARTWRVAGSYTSMYGLASDNYRGLGYADNNDYLAYKLDFGTGIKNFYAGIAAVFSGGTIEIHIGSVSGTLAGTLHVGVTGAWNHYTTQSAAVSGLTGVQTVYLVFKGPRPGIANISCLAFA
ncbi:MAG TPA: carbohydrate-binding protein, partial [Tepidisphaeraceae bacterium]|nr:carbohydrate-binding protein [Tepidisphaeraceae bacterium]